MSVLDGLTLLLLAAAAFFFLAGTVGILRFPDALTRLHAVTKADNLGLGFVVLALILQADAVTGALKLIVIWLLALVASGTSAFLISSSTAAPRQRPREPKG
jgi:multicomponent Na+:H+ antiporter subunit G